MSIMSELDQKVTDLKKLIDDNYIVFVSNDNDINPTVVSIHYNDTFELWYPDYNDIIHFNDVEKLIELFDNVVFFTGMRVDI